MELNEQLEFAIDIETKAKRIARDNAARTRRRKNKTIAASVLERRYARNRKLRKNK